MIDFFPKEHISCSSKKRFGVCDVPAAEEKAYIAEREGENWIAVVDNYYQSKVNFVPIDHTASNFSDLMVKWITAVMDVCFMRKQSYLSSLKIEVLKEPGG